MHVQEAHDEDEAVVGHDEAPLMRPAEPVVWPGTYTAAASFAFDVDAESAALITEPATADRMSVMSHQGYGPLVGVPRLLRILERHGVPATFFVPGYTARRHPTVVREIAAAGHELAHHGYLHEPLAGVNPEEEARILDRGLEALEEVAGVRPVGYRAPMWELTWASPALLAGRGFLYDSSLMDADVPYELALEDGSSLVEVPIYWGLDDWEQYCFVPDVSGTGYINSPRDAVAMWREEYHAMRAEGSCFVLTSHPFLSGRPARAVALEGLIAEAVEDEHTWVASLEEIARHVRSLRLPPRSITRPA